MASYFGNEPVLPLANDLLDPTNCPLHIQKMTGRISFTMDEEGNYPVGAPPCYCILGIREAIKNEKPVNLFEQALNERNAIIEEKTGLPWKEGLAKFKEMFPLEYNAYEEDFKRLSATYPKEFAAMQATAKEN